MKKAITSFLLILALILSLSACKSADSLQPSEAPAPSDSQQSIDSMLDALDGLSQTNPDGSPAVTLDENINIGNPSSTQPVKLPEPLPEGKPVKVPTDKNGMPKNPLYAPYINSFIKDGIYKFSCIYSTSEDDLNLSMPFTLALKGAKSFISMDMTLIAGQSMTTNVITNGSKSYIVLPTFKQYITSTPSNNEEMLGDVSNLITPQSGKYVGTTEVKSNGKTYICETYKESSMTVKCYFLDGKTLDRQEIITAEGNIILTDIRYSNDVEDELFELPSGYKNIDKLVGLMS